MKINLFIIFGSKGQNLKNKTYETQKTWEFG